MKEQFFYQDCIIFYRNSNMKEGTYYAAWEPLALGNHHIGYNWDETPYEYKINIDEVSEKWFLLRGYECRPPHIKK